MQSKISSPGGNWHFRHNQIGMEKKSSYSLRVVTKSELPSLQWLLSVMCDSWKKGQFWKKRMERHMQVFSSRLASFSSELIITWCPPWRWQSGQKEEVDSALGPFSLAAPVGKMGLISADSTSGVSPTSSHHLCTQGMVQGALVRMTRSQISSQITVSPRGGLALCRGSRWV